MSKKESKEFSIEVVEQFPRKRNEKSKVYDSIVKTILKKGIGKYKVDVPEKKPATVYLGLIKHIKKEKLSSLHIHFIGKTVYIEVLS